MQIYMYMHIYTGEEHTEGGREVERERERERNVMASTLTVTDTRG